MQADVLPVHNAPNFWMVYYPSGSLFPTFFNDLQVIVPIELPSTTLSRDSCQMYLMQDPSNTAKWYPDATILFAGVAGFTKMSQSLTPIQAMDLLSSVLCQFDDLVLAMSMTTKVRMLKMVGDCYMVAALGPNTCAHMCHLALRMIQAFSKTLLDLSIGIYIGTCDTYIFICQWWTCGSLDFTQSFFVFYDWLVGLTVGPVMAGVIKSSSSNSSSNATNLQQRRNGRMICGVKQ